MKLSSMRRLFQQMGDSEGWLRRFLVRMLPGAVILLLAIWPLRTVLFLPGMVGFGWDWGIPPYPDQVGELLSSRLYSYSDHSLGGENLQAPDLFFIALLFLLSNLLGGLLPGFLLAGLMALAGIGAFKLGRQLDFAVTASIAAAALYMYSPFVYSRIIAGHVQLLFGYALLPFLVLVSIRALRSPWTDYRSKIAAGVLFVLVAQSHVFLGIAAISVMVLLAVDLLIRNKPRRSLSFLGVLVGIWLLLDAYWLIPTLSRFSDLTIWYFTRTDPLSRWPVLSPSLLDSLRLIAAENGLATEVIFPIQGLVFWEIASIVLPILAFLPLVREPRSFRTLFLSTLAIVGLALVSIARTPLFPALSLLLVNAGPVGAAFSNPNRFIPLVALPYAILIGSSADQLGRFVWKRIRDMQATYSRPTLALLRRAPVPGFVVVLLLALVIYPWPFLAGDMTARPSYAAPDQPYALVSTPISEEYSEVYAFLRSLPSTSRVAYLPAPFTGYPSEYWSGQRELFHTTTSYFPISDLFTPISSKPAQLALLSLYGKTPSVGYAVNLMRLAGVQYLIFTDYDAFSSYIEGLDYPSLRQNVLTASDLTLVKQVGKTRIFRIEGSFPHAFGAGQLALVSGDLSTVLTLMESPEFLPFNTVPILAAQLEEDVVSRLLPESPVLAVEPSWGLRSLMLPDLVGQGYAVALGTRPNLLPLDSSSQPSPDDLWSQDWRFAADVTPGGVLTSPRANFSFSMSFPGEGAFTAYILAYPLAKSSSLGAYVDNSSLGQTEVTRGDRAGYRWIRLGALDLPATDHHINLRVMSGTLALKVFALVPEGFEAGLISSWGTRTYVFTGSPETGDLTQVRNENYTIIPEAPGDLLNSSFDGRTIEDATIGWQVADRSGIRLVRTGPEPSAAIGITDTKIWRPLSTSTVGLGLSFSYAMPTLIDPGSPDNWAALVLEFADKTRLYYAFGGPFSHYESPTDRIITVGTGEQKSWIRVGRDVSEDTKSKFGEDKQVVSVILADHTSEGLFDDVLVTWQPQFGICNPTVLNPDNSPGVTVLCGRISRLAPGTYRLLSYAAAAGPFRTRARVNGADFTALGYGTSGDLQVTNLGSLQIDQDAVDFQITSDARLYYSRPLVLVPAGQSVEAAPGPQECTSDVRLGIVKNSPVGYEVSGALGSCSGLVFSEQFDLRWSATDESGNLLSHHPAYGFLNLYMPVNDAEQIRLQYSESTITFGLFVTGGSLGALVALWVVPIGTIASRLRRGLSRLSWLK